jgi:hypothetical protein
MSNLRAHKTRLGDPRPFQDGRIEGQHLGVSATETIDWLVDTGASICAITKDSADKFDLHPTGATASATSGGAGIIMKSGMTIVFTVEDSSGTNSEQTCFLDVGVKPDNQGSEVLGMDQINHCGVKVRWDPSAQTGALHD